ncbi:hypothetical protein HRR83_003223 [Exophiala dermatitidis]|uniref:EthD domain-containing protein n=1 Tax=Exophiala dermatitidis TaxID=5970 RepID=A0AAN6EWE2_EXODE|nr:hypothetical protein HRR75_004224 [Exophiala dermatitidis]KAJ4518325.1 hypothetical protein HRR74_004620 [Exophiala dermatitidis]KAJ4521223.1 hypothetical protein HRR73_003564 [Exophiala dermatitidis]KAJ4547815.1 hypothetical protein HRR76_000438 [Exophiala dermatitidis]KAJ4553753.1 hypothetical protein HRR77_002127 [Exophiala dermatitidis]
MGFNATVLYPNEPDTTFDMKYYLSNHMPLVEERFKKYGLKSWEVIQYYDTAAGGSSAQQQKQSGEEKPPFVTGCTLVWDSPDQLGAAMSSEDAKPVLDDIKNFCNKGPVFLGGQVVGKSST